MSSYDIRVKWFGLLHHQHQERYQVLQESILEENSCFNLNEIHLLFSHLEIPH